MSQSDTVEIEAKLTALLDSYYHGREARRFCRTDADREFSKLVMDDLETQIRKLRTQLKAVGERARRSAAPSALKLPQHRHYTHRQSKRRNKSASL